MNLVSRRSAWVRLQLSLPSNSITHVMHGIDTIHEDPESRKCGRASKYTTECVHDDEDESGDCGCHVLA